MQTKEGGIKTVSTIIKRYGVNEQGKSNHFTAIGRIGGKKTIAGGCKPKGFAVNRELARRAGSIGGKVSKRTALTRIDKEKVIALWRNGQSIKSLANFYKVAYTTMYRIVTTELKKNKEI